MYCPAPFRAVRGLPLHSLQEYRPMVGHGVRNLVKQALSVPGICGLVIGTRPDCIDGEKLRLLSTYKERGYIVEMEYGIESVYDATLKRVNRGHDFACTRRALELTKEYGLDAGGHIILGLPGETRDMLVGQARILNTLPVNFLKFHQLQILKETPIRQEFAERPEAFFRTGPDEYISLLADLIERLRPDIAIGRIVSSVPPRFTDAPWGLLRPDELLRKLERRLEIRDSFQGAKREIPV